MLSVRRGQVELRVGSVERLPAFAVPFDRILSVNAMQFWSEPIEHRRVERRFECRTTNGGQPTTGLDMSWTARRESPNNGPDSRDCPVRNRRDPSTPVTT